MKTTALIMAGGKGERFWPKSRVNMPKQFLSLTDDGKTMIQLTVERISPLVDIKDVYVATNKNYRELVKQQLPGIPEENILCEPVGRNTAPCVGLGAVHVASKYDDAVMIVLPSDHLIKNNEVFADTFKEAVQIAEEGANLVTVGIQRQAMVILSIIRMTRRIMLIQLKSSLRSQTLRLLNHTLLTEHICGTVECSCGRYLQY